MGPKEEVTKASDGHNPLKVPLAILFYSVCSSTMLLANKLAVGGIAPTVLGAVQMAFAVVTVYILSLTGAEANIDSLGETPKVPAIMYRPARAPPRPCAAPRVIPGGGVGSAYVDTDGPTRRRHLRSRHTLCTRPPSSRRFTPTCVR